MRNQKEKASSKKKEPKSNQPVVEEKINKETGDIQNRIYFRGRLLWDCGFAKCYELTCAENKKIFAAKVVPKSRLVNLRKLKLFSEIQIHKSLRHPQIVILEHCF